jgi:energy-coupling factor transport system permease protein
MKQPWAWVAWLVAVLVLLSITRNPLYLVIILCCIFFVGLCLRGSGSHLLKPFSLWKFALWIITFTTVFNALTSHYGKTILITIPGNLPLLSGNVTLEAVVYGATNGLILIGMLASFMVLNLALPIRDLISLIPRPFFPVAVVTSIAVTYLPTTLRQFRQIREAQAIRGHQMRTLRDWLPLLIPLLVGGLEHAMQLAEAMTARGFAGTNTADGGRQVLPRVFLLFGVVVLTMGWLSNLSGNLASGWIIIAVGIVLIVIGLWQEGKYSHRTKYHRPVWGWQDILALIITLCILAIFLLPIPGLNRESLYYDPYPKLSMPSFNPILGLAMLGLLTPGFFILSRNHLGDKYANTAQRILNGRTRV